VVQKEISTPVNVGTVVTFYSFSIFFTATLLARDAESHGWTNLPPKYYEKLRCTVHPFCQDIYGNI